jgi:5-hydroxyisourate hydrolase-like protein (transthyretin family)
VTILLLLLASFSGTCQCITRRGLAESDAVFRGAVIGIRNLTDSVGVYEIEFEVYKWLKGQQKPTRCKVYENAYHEDIPFEMDAVYEVYTYYGPKGHLLTDGCTETRKITERAWLYTWNVSPDSVAKPGGGNGSIKGVVTDTKGKPVKDMVVILYKIEGSYRRERTVLPGMDGSYLFPKLDSSEYHFLVSATGYDSKYFSGIYVTDQDIVLNVAVAKTGKNGSRTIKLRYVEEGTAEKQKR